MDYNAILQAGHCVSSRQLQQSRSLCAQEVWLKISRQLLPRSSPEPQSSNSQPGYVLVRNVDFNCSTRIADSTVALSGDKWNYAILFSAGQVANLMRHKKLLWKDSTRYTTVFVVWVLLLNIKGSIYGQDGCMTGKVSSISQIKSWRLWHRYSHSTPLRASISLMVPVLQTQQSSHKCLNWTKTKD